MYSKFSKEFLDGIFEEVNYTPHKRIVNKLRHVVADEIAFKLRTRLIDYLDMTRKIENADEYPLDVTWAEMFPDSPDEE